MIVLLKLLNTEEVLGELIYENDDVVHLSNPLAIQLEKEYQTGITNALLVDYAPHSKQEIYVFKNTHIISKIEMNESMSEYYEKSLLYNKKIYDKKVKSSIQIAISQLDTIIENYSVDKKTKTKYNKELVDKFIIMNNIPTSNSVN